MEYQIFEYYPGGDSASVGRRDTLLKLLANGWEIVEASPARNCVVYILKKGKV